MRRSRESGAARGCSRGDLGRSRELRGSRPDRSEVRGDRPQRRACVRGCVRACVRASRLCVRRATRSMISQLFNGIVTKDEAVINKIAEPQFAAKIIEKAEEIKGVKYTAPTDDAIEKTYLIDKIFI